MTEQNVSSVHERWAKMRFSVIGQLLAAPPRKGALRAQLEGLAAREWRHPISGKLVRFGLSTLERWLAAARKATIAPRPPPLIAGDLRPLPPLTEAWSQGAVLALCC